ncbi:AraC family transcriptional regulator [Hyphomicrobium sp.]|uniref:helix-turn-helix transcriptional regulator n=1 Tax=Hyphomicrobium sp. TaxID=82 RepID=UPI002D0B21B2|nr:AraC family transcriptional regulator [Hyphomicrobium sp.]HRN84895.1 AraC family transcriptional regulator [Hyphomicrobium sp.]HRQ26097.1 AraC family transcriptional regulator [Hyphomicrobium sp.]
MYERAATTETDLKPIWHLDAGRALFVGPLTYNAPHAHSVPVYLAGLYAPFAVRIGAEPWTQCRTAVIPAGVTYALRLEGQPLAVFYLEPSEAGSDALLPLVTNGREVAGAVIGTDGELSEIRAIYETPDSLRWVGAALDSLLAFSTPRAHRALDPRIAAAVALMSERPDDTVSAVDAAGHAGLSSSRFQHLFAREVGVPFRRFRSWQRLRHAIGEVVAGSSFTSAAHAAGFSDQAHFANTFRRTFGAPASPSLGKLRSA